MKKFGILVISAVLLAACSKEPQNDAIVEIGSSLNENINFDDERLDCVAELYADSQMMILEIVQKNIAVSENGYDEQIEKKMDSFSSITGKINVAQQHELVMKISEKYPDLLVNVESSKDIIMARYKKDADFRELYDYFVLKANVSL